MNTSKEFQYNKITDSARVFLPDLTKLREEFKSNPSLYSISNDEQRRMWKEITKESIPQYGFSDVLEIRMLMHKDGAFFRRFCELYETFMMKSLASLPKMDQEGKNALDRLFWHHVLNPAFCHICVHDMLDRDVITVAWAGIDLPQSGNITSHLVDEVFSFVRNCDAGTICFLSAMLNGISIEDRLCGLYNIYGRELTVTNIYAEVLFTGLRSGLDYQESRRSLKLDGDMVGIGYGYLFNLYVYVETDNNIYLLAALEHSRPFPMRAEIIIGQDSPVCVIPVDLGELIDKGCTQMEDLEEHLCRMC